MSSAFAKEFSKKELLGLLAASRARQRSGIEITEVRLTEWIDQFLLAPGTRQGNDGLRPRYAYSAGHYRRALQIARLYARGIKDRDAILFQLFLEGRDTPPFELETAIRKEFEKAAKMALAPIRSAYVNRTAEIPPHSKSVLIRQLGPLNQVFGNTKLKLNPNDLIEIVRMTLQAGVSRTALQTSPNSMQGLSSLMSVLSGPIASIYPGFLVFDDHGRWEHTTRVICQADRVELETIRIHFNEVINFISQGLDGIITPSSDPAQFQLVGRSLRSSREWSVIIFVFIAYLRQSSDIPTAGIEAELSKITPSVNEG